MVDNKLKVGLGLLTVLATPIAVNVVSGSEVHAAEQKSAVVEKSATEKSVAENKQNVTEKPVVAEKSDNKAVVADKKVTEKSEENKTESVKQVENKENTLPKEGGKPSDGKEEQDKTGYDKGIFYDNGKLANWWYDDGQDWYFFQNGKKHTGEGKDNAGNHYFVNGKYANGYQKETYYVKGSLANWWYDDGTAWYFFQNGKKHTGEGKDNAGNHYFVNGKYATGEYDGKIYVEGKETTPVKDGYKNGVFFADGKLANWWYDDGTAWYFFQNGKKHTGEGKDNAGYHYFVNGKYGTGEYNGKVYIEGKEITPIKNGYKNGFFFVDSKLANWWHDDGKDWYFFKNGKKYTGVANDSAGTHRFVNGKYDNNVPALNMPQYYQNDARWGRKVYGMSNLAAAGCVPTSLAMVFSGLGKPVLPTAVADTISNGGGLNYGGFGTSAKGAADAIKKYGYNYRVLKTKEQLVNALRNGESVLATVQQGYFVRSAYETHAVVLSGFDNGKVRALDPYNKNATGKWYNINEIWNQRSTAASDTMLGGSFTAIEK